MFNHNGMLRSRHLSKWPIRPVVTLSALLLASLLGGCVTTGTLTSATNTESQCAAWRRIRYSVKDTELTAVQVRQHNQTGRNLRCWK